MPVMNPLGVHTHLFRGPPAVVATAVRRHGLTCVQLTPNFPGLHFDEPGQVTPARCRLAAEPFQQVGLLIAALSGGGPLLDADLDRRHRGVVRWHALIRNCRAFGTDKIVVETGSLSAASPSLPEPSNQSAAAWTELGLILAEGLRLAADHGVRVLLKPEPAQVIASCADAARLHAELAHPNLAFIMDPANLLLADAIAPTAEHLGLLWDRLGPWAPIVHAKDLRLTADGPTTPPIGQGALDYARFFRLADRHQPQAPVILEHVRAEEIPQALAAVARARADLPFP
jgi:sugar phosphate isomerase/epimerase